MNGKWTLWLILATLGLFNSGCYSPYDASGDAGLVGHSDQDPMYAEEDADRWDSQGWLAQEQGLESEDWQD